MVVVTFPLNIQVDRNSIVKSKSIVAVSKLAINISYKYVDQVNITLYLERAQ